MLLRVVVAAGICYGGWLYYRSTSRKSRNSFVHTHSHPQPKPVIIPTRSEQLTSLQSNEEYDVLVIGGGATGVGVALDAVTRGLKTALVEKDDFSSGTSCKSTKLIHGGVRYLYKAVLGLDYEQYKLVTEALRERAHLLEIAPHLSDPLPIMLPVYKYWQVPYFWAGLKMYDVLSGKQLVKPSYFVTKQQALEAFPMLKRDKLCGAIVYYDGQHDDSRMNVAIALTAAREGAHVANHVEVISLLKTKKEGEEKEVVSGARMRDTLTGKEWDVKAKVVVNATGPFTDLIRRMDNSEVMNICRPSAGIHISLPSYYSPYSMGLLDPSTSDGRVIFFLPWRGITIAGTTDAPTDITFTPYPREHDVQFILQEIRNYLSKELSVRRGDVLAAWSGIRPLVLDPSKGTDTQSIARNHIIDVSDSNLVTIAGGKWTTYRAMAEDTVDRVVEVGGFSHAKGCKTIGYKLVGGECYYPTFFIHLIQDYGLDEEVARHLAKSYGDQAPEIAKLSALTGKRWPVIGKRLIPDFPYIEAEIKYVIQKEYACTAVDVLARRTRLVFQNVQAAYEVLPRIIEIMGDELKWNKARRKEELESASKYCESMGLKVRTESRDVPITLSYTEAQNYIKKFKAFDRDGDGHISVLDLRKVLQDLGEKVEESQLRELISEVDLNKNNTIEEDEFLQLMSALRTGVVANSRMAALITRMDEHKKVIPVTRSGGGV
jgi:glycerol-3-phosphate dehydrogenase